MKKAWLAILVIALIAAAIGYYMFNKKHFNVASAVPVVEITAATLHQTFSTDTVVAKNKFIGDEVNQKVIQVNGVIAEIKKDQQSSTIILLKTATAGAFVNCTIEGNTGNISTGNTITIKGICTGYNFDADMGIPGDVILTRCYLIK